MSKRTVEKFEIKDGKRGAQPLIIGIEGPPGGGKTFSSLRLATGIQRVRQGPIVVIDTDNERAGAYADIFEFKHLILRPPFRSLRFADAILNADALRPAAIIIDSMSDEHEGSGGVLDYHSELKESFGGGDNQNQRAWIKPKAERLKMIETMLQLPTKTPLILNFRARQKTKPDAKGKPVNIGWSPIAPAEITGNCTVLCLLPPSSDGTPKWKTGVGEEDFVLKLPIFARPIFAETGQLSEAQGEALAKWARGDASKLAPPKGKPKEPPGAAGESAGEQRDDAPPADDSDLFPPDRPAFEFAITDLRGSTKRTGDGEKWAATLCKWLSERVDGDLQKTWANNKAHVEAAALAGHSALAKKVWAVAGKSGLEIE